MTTEQEYLLKIVQNKASSEPTDVIDWIKLADECTRHQILNFIYLKLENIIPNNINNLWYRHYLNNKIRSKLNLRYVKDICEYFQKENIRYILYKGFPLSKRIYNDTITRQFSDNDFIINLDDLQRAHKLLRNLGYVNIDCRFPSLNPPMIDQEVPVSFYATHLLPYININTRVMIELHTTIPLLSELYQSELFINSNPFNINGFPIITFNLQYTLLTLIGTIYLDDFNGASITKEEDTLNKINIKLRNYVDLNLFLSKYDKEINWGEIYKKTKMDLEFAFATIFVFENLNTIFHNDITDKVYQMFKIYQSEHQIVWKTNLIDSIFSNVKHRENKDIFEKQRGYLAKIKYCTESNPNYYAPYIVKQNNLYVPFYKRNNELIQYRIEKSENNLIIFLNLNMSIHKKFIEVPYILDIQLWDHRFRDDYLSIHYSIIYRSNKYIAFISKEVLPSDWNKIFQNAFDSELQTYLNKSENADGTVELKLLIPYEIIDICELPVKKCYNLLLWEIKVESYNLLHEGSEGQINNIIYID